MGWQGHCSCLGALGRWESRQGVATARRGAGGHSLASSQLLILREETFGLGKVRGSGRVGAESRPGSVCLASLSWCLPSCEHPWVNALPRAGAGRGHSPCTALSLSW